MSIFSRGRNAKLLVRVDTQNLVLFVKNFRVQENAAEGEDSCCGEDRDRPWIETGFFRFTFSAYQKDASTIASWLSMIAQHDSQAAELNAVCGITYNYRNGTKQSYMATQCTRMPLDVNSESRAGATMFDSGFKARYYKSTQ